MTESKFTPGLCKEMYEVLQEVLYALSFHHPDMNYSISRIKSVLRKAREESEVSE